MPHQCLGCGFAFEEGSSALLAGCPKCNGTKFFYSAKPATEDERREMQATTQDDLRAVVQNVLAETSPSAAKEMAADGDGWAELTPKQLRKIVKQVQADHKSESKPVSPAPMSAQLPNAFNDKPVDSPQRLKEARKIRDDIIAEFAASNPESRPDTVEVQGEGQYDVDLKGLLEKDPIVIHKDGAYMIHLPSLFDGNKKK